MAASYGAARPSMASRVEVIDEMAASEARFLRAIRSMIAVFAEPMSRDGVLSAEETGAVFRNIESVRDAHTQLKAVMDAASEADSVGQGIKALHAGLSSMASSLRTTYAHFLGSNSSALRTLDAVSSRPEVRKALATRDERVAGASLRDLLLRPAERLDEVRNLCQDLVLLSGPDDPAAAAAEACRDIAAFAPRAPRIDSHEHLSHSATAEARASAAIPDPPYTPGISGDRDAADPDASGITRADAARAQQEAAEAESRLAAAQAALASGREQLRQSNAAADLRARERALLDTDAERDAMEVALSRLQREEDGLYERLASSGSREMLEAFLRKKRELQAEEDRLAELLEQHEETLAELRERLANPPEELLPSDPAKRQLYVAWKSALRDREEILRQARSRKHRLMRDLREQHETQVILLEMQRRAAVDGLREAVDEERAKADAHRRELARLDTSIEEARETMRGFRKEFEDLRVALLVDRMAKASQVATLTQRRKQLEEESARFREQVEAAKERVAAEEAAKWEAKLQAVKEDGRRRVEEVRARGRERLDRIRQDMAKSFEESFRPLLHDAEERHRREMESVQKLRTELQAREEELRRAEKRAEDAAGVAGSAAGGGSGGEDGKQSEDVPEWRQREFEDLKRYVTDMWERLEVPDEDVLAFLAECEELAPFDARVLDMYRDMYARLADGDADVVGAAVAEEPEQGRERAGGSGSGARASGAGAAARRGRSAVPRGAYGEALVGDEEDVDAVDSSALRREAERTFGASTDGANGGPSGRGRFADEHEDEYEGEGDEDDEAEAAAAADRATLDSFAAGSRRRHDEADPRDAPSAGTAAAPSKRTFDGLAGVDEDLCDVARGLRIRSMSMRDATRPEKLWQDSDWDAATMWELEKVAVLPKEILDCHHVARALEFSSERAIADLRLVQRMVMLGEEVETMTFEFGFVIPGSTNTWEQTIVSAPKGSVIPAHLLSGNLVAESTFFSGKRRLGTTRVRIVYE
ncbi:hypothetical protein FNF28_04842 [Cafeteria roenbergensis]|uniref:DH domain-containing protein n=1 Tax=Cafeteria roenbergensis TaxID=33653 RepID=A0A5A8D9P1_CAFRO|nr:hypothetical protein FNF28_04842 [Cafeteria roenbergensis]